MLWTYVVWMQPARSSLLGSSIADVSHSSPLAMHQGSLSASDTVSNILKATETLRNSQFRLQVAHILKVFSSSVTAFVEQGLLFYKCCSTN